MMISQEFQSPIHPKQAVRRGFTLIEMLVVMTLTSVLLGLMLVLASGIIRRVSQADMHLAQLQNVQEAAEAMRGLLGGAPSLRVEDSGRAIVLANGQGRLQLADKPFRLELTRSGVPGKRIFGLTGLERGRFSTAAVTGGQPVAVLELWPESSAEKRVGRPAQAQPFRIEAAFGPNATADAGGVKP